MPIRTYEVELEGTQPLLMHHDNIEHADELRAWREKPENKKLSRPGDDRSPAFTWLGSLYHDEKNIVMPEDNLRRCFMEGGAQVPVPGGKNGKTFKSQSQSGVLIHDHWPLYGSNGKTIDMAPFKALAGEAIDFQKHLNTAKKYGIALFTKRAKIGQNKHIRVRPKFMAWSLRGQLDVIDDQITTPILKSILEAAGRYKGLGDWRPSSPTPGRYGTFNVISCKEV